MRVVIKSGTTGFWIILVLVAISPLSTFATSEQRRNEVSDECHSMVTEKTVAVIHGSFTVKNSPPIITDLALLKNSSSTILKIDVADRNTLRDIKEIVVTVKMNKSHGENEKKRAIYRWTPAEGWELIGKSKWGIAAEGSKEPADLTATSGTWCLSFVSEGNIVRGSYWDIYVEVRDSQATVGKTLCGYQIQWNREIAVLHRLQAIFSVLKSLKI